MRLLTQTIRAGLLIATMSFLSSTQAHAANVLDNPGFEDVTVDPWFISGPSSVDLQSVEVHTGLQALRIRTTGGTGFFEARQTLPWVVDDSAYASVWTKTELQADTDLRAGLVLQFLDGTSTTLLEVKREVAGQWDWRLLELSAVAPVATTQVRVQLFLYTDTLGLSAEAFFDDAMLDISTQQPMPQTTLLNPGFEQGLSDWIIDGWPASIVTSPVFEAVYAMDTTVTDVATQDFWSALYQDISITGSEAVHASVRVTTDFDVGAQAVAGLMLQFFDAMDTPLLEVKDEQRGRPAVTWRVLELYQMALPSAVRVRLTLFLWAPMGDVISVGEQVFFDAAVYEQTTPPSVPCGRQLLLNPGFEDPVVPERHWTSEGTSIGVPVVAPVHTGAHAERVAVNSVATVFWTGIVQEALFEPNAPIYGAAYVKTTIDPLVRVDQANAGLQIEFLDALRAPIGYLTDELGGTRDWLRTEVTGISPPGTASVRFIMFLWADEGELAALDAQAYFDDAYLAKVTRRLSPQRQLLNADFENGLHDWMIAAAADGVPPQGTTSPVHAGVYAGQDTVRDLGGPSFFSEVYQEIELTRCRGALHYDASAWLKPDFVSAEAVGGLNLKFLREDRSLISEVQEEIGGMAEWTELQLSGEALRAAPDKTHIIRFSLWTFDANPQDGNGSVAFDDATLGLRWDLAGPITIQDLVLCNPFPDVARRTGDVPIVVYDPSRIFEVDQRTNTEIQIPTDPQR